MFHNFLDFEAEFLKIKDHVLYLDWNIISYMADLDTLPVHISDKVLCLMHALEVEIDRSQICIPYSDIHFRDILLGSTDHHSRKIEMLSRLTKNWKVYESGKEKEKLELIKAISIADDFERYRASAVFNDDPLNLPRDLTEKLVDIAAQGTEVQEVFRDILPILLDTTNSSGLQMLRFNKKIRNSRTKEIRRFYSSVPRDKVLSHPNIQQYVSNLLAKTGLQYQIIETLNSTIATLCRTFMTDFSISVMQLVNKCDLIGLTSEDLSKPSAFQGITNDSLHLSLALRCHFFVSEDKNLLIKANFIKKWLGLRVTIFDIDEFILFVCRGFYRKQNEADGSSVVFNLPNGRQRTYEL